MVKQIAFFVEGEEHSKDNREEMKLRKTFHRVFKELEQTAQERGLKLQFRLYKSRRATYEKFCEAVKNAAADVYPVLLVDSEAPVVCEDPIRQSGMCWEHVRARADDRWERPAGVDDEQCQPDGAGDRSVASRRPGGVGSILR